MPVDSLLKLVLILIMFAIGATLRFSDFRRIFWYPKSLVLGLVLQMLFLPAFAFIILSLVDISPYYKIGFIVVALCPGGTTSNFISYLVNADVALSISLTTINSFLILITIPFGVNLGLAYFLDTQSELILPFFDTAKQVFSVILLPAFLGLCFNHFFRELSLKVRMPLKYINVILLAAVYALKLWGDSDGGGGVTIAELKKILPIAMFLQIVSMLTAYYLARKTVQRNTSALTIGIEVGLQNTALALFIASVLLDSERMASPALVYAMFSFFTTLLFAWIVYKFIIIPSRQKYLL